MLNENHFALNENYSNKLMAEDVIKLAREQKSQISETSLKIRFWRYSLNYIKTFMEMRRTWASQQILSTKNTPNGIKFQPEAEKTNHEQYVCYNYGERGHCLSVCQVKQKRI